MSPGLVLAVLGLGLFIGALLVFAVLNFGAWLRERQTTSVEHSFTGDADE